MEYVIIIPRFLWSLIQATRNIIILSGPVKEARFE